MRGSACFRPIKPIRSILIRCEIGIPQRNLFDQMMGNWNMDLSPATVIADAWQRVFSPYQTNPFNFNPLRDRNSAAQSVRSDDGQLEYGSVAGDCDCRCVAARVFALSNQSVQF